MYHLVYLLILLTHKNASASAVVCYAADRNELRSRVIQWLQTEVIPDGWFVKGSNFSDILHKYFKVGRKKDTMDHGLTECTQLLLHCFYRNTLVYLSVWVYSNHPDL